MYVTLKAPGSEKTSPELHIERIDLQLFCNKLQILDYQEMQKKYVMCFNFVLSWDTFGLV